MPFLEVAIAACTLIGLISSALLWYAGKVEKSYAAQREFGHLKKSLEQLNENISELFKEQEEQLLLLQRQQERILDRIFFRDTKEPPTRP